MSAFYDEMADAALDLIAEFGQELILKRVTGEVYDPVTGTTTPGITETQAVRAVVLPASKGTVEAFDQKFVNGTLIETNLHALKIAAKGLAWPPAPGNTVTLEGFEWTLIGATASNPAGTPLVYSTSIMR